MVVGMVGLYNSGKSELFNSLLK